jgi:hypothetical protein
MGFRGDAYRVIFGLKPEGRYCLVRYGGLDSLGAG